MNREISNRKQLALLLAAGLILVPMMGTVPSLVAPDQKPNGESTRSAKIEFVVVFCAAGAAITAYAVRWCPSRITFGEKLTVHYLFHERTFSRDEVQRASIESRSSTLGHGIGQMTAEDARVCLKSTDGSQVKWAMPHSTSAEFKAAFKRWVNERAG